MDLSIIIVNWNSAHFLLDAVASVRQYTRDLAYEIVVVDNASAKDDLDKLRAHVPEINLVACRENLGFAGANNEGSKHSTGEYLLFLNPDTKLVSPAINVLIDNMRVLLDAGILGCKLLNSDLSVQLSSIQKFPTLLNQVLDLEYLQLRWPHCPLWEMAPLFEDNVKPVSVEAISGACMLIRREVFVRVGGFSEDYFMYAEDIDLNYKVKQAGFTNYYVGGASVIHYGGKSSSLQRVNHWSTMMKCRAIRKLFDNTRGKTQGGLYRVTMGCAAVVRLGLLLAAYPFGNIVRDRASVRNAIEKWKVVLRWALGQQEVRLSHQ